jgi:hypothetical protein
MMNMSADQFVWVRLIDGNVGDHQIVGSVTKTRYGYRAHGQLFKMARSDAASKPHAFLVVPDPNVAQAQPAEVTAPPAPQPFVTWDEGKKTKDKKKVAA